ncbi:type IV secretory system conjugative DNA transfer family protein [Dorea amylophila]|uniref:type IV secretory system conjugative DNA transfer family protein n=1 Tax=Dorea amylophila TaxID=2981789 RepID=UPI0022E35040|nr:type IV secretory system conjugative DNA transfer family protein [Dorea amylophila]
MCLVFLPFVWWAAAITACAIAPDKNFIQILETLSEKLDFLGIGIYESQKRNYRRGVEHGSAKWGNVSEICRRYCEKRYTQNLLLTQHFRMGLDGYKHKRNLNVLVVGGSGAGKSRTYAIPNIMQCNCSMVITDPKAELLRKTGGVLERNGYEVRVFDLINPETSWCYNPFAYVWDDKDVLKLINNLIRNTTPKGAQSSDPFWEKSETALLQALMLYLLHEAPPEEQNFPMIMEMLGSAQVKEDDEDYQSPLDILFERLEMRDPESIAVKQYAIYKQAAGVVCSKRLLNQAVGKSLRTHNLKPKKGAQVMRKNEKITALYERLSRDDFGKDDDQQRESNSISNQKAMLEEFAARQGFTNIVHFTDDGISGTCFDRPGFLAMMKEVEAGNVEYLCIKDMSRMGRDYLKVGQIMEILRQRGVRLIAINDGVDSARGDDDFTPFRNIMNEYYARDTSRKIRSTFQSKGKSGKHLTGTVIYGYLWNEARDQWLVDPEAAEVVKRIFAMTIEGYGPYQIASKLKEEKILIPSAYLAQHGEGVNKNKTFKDVYGWGSSTICNLLEKREYLGHTVNFKTRKHFKDKKSHYVPEDEWTIFENTHEPIIDQQTFDLVQKIRGNVRRYPDGWGEAAPLTGLLYCADCGGKMYVHRTNNGKRISQYTCSQYTKVPCGTLCKTQHRINEDVVLSLVSEMLKAIAEYAKHDRAEFVRVVQEAQSSQQTTEVRKHRTRLATAKQRVSELEVLLCKIYEDNILGKLSDSRYATLDAQYEKEQSELTAEISVLEKAVKSYEKHEKDADRFIALIDKYENFDKLTIAMLNEFIEKILVHERDRKGSIQTTQEVEIYFNFVGRFVPPAFGEVELTPEELEEIRKREERKDRLHQNYLKRKASGAQKQYEDKIKKRKKAEIEAKKAAIRAEDIAKGVFVPVSSLPQREPMKGVQTA